MPEPAPDEGAILVDGVALGICGTDAEIVRGDYGEAPPGSERLILGHESLGRVREAPADSGFAPGDLVVGIVRRPDPVPCPSCAAGRVGLLPQRRVHRARHQGAATATAPSAGGSSPTSPSSSIPSLGLLGVLMEPTTVVAKAWEQIDRDQRARVDRARARARHRRRADRPARGAAGRAARLRRPRARPDDRRAEAAARRATSARPTTPTPVPEVEPRAGHRHRGHRREPGRARRDGATTAPTASSA